MKHAVLIMCLAFPVTLGGSEHFPRENLQRCAKDGFVGIAGSPAPTSPEWIHQQYCLQTAVELAKLYIREHPELKGKQ